jgi:hypothetical protein
VTPPSLGEDEARVIRQAIRTGRADPTVPVAGIDLTALVFMETRTVLTILVVIRATRTVHTIVHRIGTAGTTGSIGMMTGADGGEGLRLEQVSPLGHWPSARSSMPHSGAHRAVPRKPSLLAAPHFTGAGRTGMNGSMEEPGKSPISLSTLRLDTEYSSTQLSELLRFLPDHPFVPWCRSMSRGTERHERACSPPSTSSGHALIRHGGRLGSS